MIKTSHYKNLMQKETLLGCFCFKYCEKGYLKYIVHLNSKVYFRKQELKSHLMKMVEVFKESLSQGFYSWTKYHDQEASWGGKGLFSLHFHIAVHHQRRDFCSIRIGTHTGQEAGADAEAMKECYLLACFPWLAQLALL